MASADALSGLADIVARLLQCHPETVEAFVSPEGVIYFTIGELIATLDEHDRWIVTQPGDGFDAVMVLTAVGDVVWSGRVWRGSPEAN
jgi:hypothetical protein